MTSEEFQKHVNGQFQKNAKKRRELIEQAAAIASKSGGVSFPSIGRGMRPGTVFISGSFTTGKSTFNPPSDMIGEPEVYTVTKSELVHYYRCIEGECKDGSYLPYASESIRNAYEEYHITTHIIGWKRYLPTSWYKCYYMDVFRYQIEHPLLFNTFEEYVIDYLEKSKGFMSGSNARFILLREAIRKTQSQLIIVRNKLDKLKEYDNDDVFEVKNAERDSVRRYATRIP